MLTDSGVQLVSNCSPDFLYYFVRGDFIQPEGFFSPTRTAGNSPKQTSAFVYKFHFYQWDSGQSNLSFWMLEEIPAIQSIHENGNNQLVLVTYRQWPVRYRDGKLFVTFYLFIVFIFSITAWTFRVIFPHNQRFCILQGRSLAWSSHSFPMVSLPVFITTYSIGYLQRSFSCI